MKKRKVLNITDSEPDILGSLQLGLATHSDLIIITKFLSTCCSQYTTNIIFIFFSTSLMYLPPCPSPSDYNPSSSWISEHSVQFSSIQFSLSVVSHSLQPHGLLHVRGPCPLPTPRVYPNSCPLSGWYHPIISSSVIPFSSCLQSFPASGSFQMSQFFTLYGQRIGVSASALVLAMNIQDGFPLGGTGWISLQSKGHSRVFSNTTVQKHQFLSAKLSL